MDHRSNIRTKIIKVYKSYNSTIKKNACHFSNKDIQMTNKYIIRCDSLGKCKSKQKWDTTSHHPLG